MKASELRIGNFVCDDYSGEMIVTAINRSNHIELAKNNSLPSGLYSVDRVIPIPITEEWLLKFGFSGSEGVIDLTNEGSGNDDYFNLNYDSENGMWIYFNEGWMYLLHIKFVHQLQNLYFSLTGEELTIIA